MSTRRATLTFGAFGVLLVICVSVVLDAFGVHLGPWWVVLCLVFELFMLSLPGKIGQSKTD